MKNVLELKCKARKVFLSQSEKSCLNTLRFGIPKRVRALVSVGLGEIVSVDLKPGQAFLDEVENAKCHNGPGELH